MALLPKGHTTGRGQKPKRSPKGRSASPGTRPGVASSGRPRGEGQIDLEGPKRRCGSDRHGQQRAEGTDLGCDRGWSSYALAPGLTNRHRGSAENLKQRRNRRSCSETRSRRSGGSRMASRTARGAAILSGVASLTTRTTCRASGPRPSRRRDRSGKQLVARRSSGRHFLGAFRDCRRSISDR